MIQDPDLIHFTCIAKGTTILAEFNSKDAELGVVAEKCLAKAPPLHSYFSHTIRSRTYTFLIDKNYVYFAIFDDKLENPEGLAFLKVVKNAFENVRKVEKRKLEMLTSHCYQGEFNPVFHQLLGPVLENVEPFRSPVGERISQSGMLQQQVPIRGRSRSGGANGLKKIKNRLLEEMKLGRKNSGEIVDHDDDGIGLSREFPLVIHKHDRGLYSTDLGGNGNQKVIKSAWKKQVWMVLSIDLFVCAILFFIWLWVCSGFQCMNN